jgi:catechol 2,3-dioxygenase-like lactoylglutathione lyase family enzyme
MAERGQAERRPVLIGAEPQLFVGDIAASLAFFTGKLGFAPAFAYGDPPFYAQVVRDAARLNLRHVDEPLCDRDSLARESYLAAAITLATRSEVEELFRDYRDAGVTFHQELKRQNWGAVDFIVADPDGNLLCFAGPAE